jgi:hypothetical protein
MKAQLIRRDGFFVCDGNDKILFLPSPAADFGYVMNEISEMERIVKFSRRWGWAEIAAVFLLAFFVRALGPLAMFAGAAACLVGSACLYRAVLERKLADKPRAPRTPQPAAEPFHFGLALLERAADDAPLALFWISGVMATGFTLISIEFAARARSGDQLVAACSGIVLFGSMVMISAWLLARRRHALAPQDLAAALRAEPRARTVEKAAKHSIAGAWTEGE